MVSGRPRSHPETFLDPVAPSSPNISPFRATATLFTPNFPNSATTLIFSYPPNPPKYIFSETLDLALCPINKIQDPSRLLRSGLVYRKLFFLYQIHCMRAEFLTFPSENLDKSRFWTWDHNQYWTWAHNQYWTWAHNQYWTWAHNQACRGLKKSTCSKWRHTTP